MSFKMICLDADGVIFRGKDFWIDLHKAFGTFEEGMALTKKYLHTDYDKLAELVVYKMWKGKDAKPYFDLVNKREYMKGIKELFKFIKKKKWVCAIISGGSLDMIKRAQKDFGADYVFANNLIIKDGKVDGYDAQVRAGFERKADIIKDLCKKLKINQREVIFIGDSKYDLNAFKLAGMAIAFNSGSEELKKHASVVVDSDDLNDIIPYLEKI
jgi:phosphoserine phosphatase